MENMSEYRGLKEVSKDWGLSIRRVLTMIEDGRVDGAIKIGHSWFVPSTLEKPEDGRVLRKISRPLNFGKIDVEKMDTLKKKIPLDQSLLTSTPFINLISRVISHSLKKEGIQIKNKSAEKILSFSPVDSLPLSTELLIINFFSLILESKEYFKVSLMELKKLYTRLTQGITYFPKMREGLSFYTQRENTEATVEQDLKNFLFQYALIKDNLHPVPRSVILYSELLRIKPFETYNDLFATLVMASCLVSSGYLPPFENKENEEEEKATLALSIKRGQFRELTSLKEREIYYSYNYMKKAFYLTEFKAEN